MTRRVLRSWRAYVAFAHDIVMAGLSFVVALYLRTGGDGFAIYADRLWPGALLFAAVAAAVFWQQRLYQGIWRYASLNDLLNIAKSTTAVIAVFLLLMFLGTRLDDLPRSLPIINWFVLMALLGGPRVAYRWLKDRRLEFHLEQAGHRRVPVLLVGAGDATELFIRSLVRDSAGAYRVVGIVSRDPGRVGRRIQDIEVLDTLDHLSHTVEELDRRGNRPQRLILTMEDLDAERVNRLLEETETLGMTLARLPRLTDFRGNGSVAVEVRPIAIEDLLNRPQATLDRDAMRGLIAGRRVMITGAGGSIGSELVRQVSDFGPAALTLLDNGEFALYTVDLELGERHPDLTRHAVLADVRDRDGLFRLFRAIKPEIVFHAAALKHVPLVEANPVEGALTNVIGSRNTADACIAAGVGIMVQISTDKAVNPTNIMGATKRLAENYTQALDLAHAGRAGATRFVTVRFGNVLGSTGSVVPLFQKQLAAGGPLTVTHPDMTRYFMTIREAVELVLQASALSHGGREGTIFVLDMGKPVRILELARQMIRLAGRRPDKDIKIVITGPRPGEKLFEEVLHGAEPPVPTESRGILLASPRAADLGSLSAGLDRLESAARAGDSAGVLALIRELVPEYAPPEAAPPAA